MSATNLPIVKSIEDLTTEYYNNLNLKVVTETEVEEAFEKIKASYNLTSNQVTHRPLTNQTELETLKFNLLRPQGFGIYHVVKQTCTMQQAYADFADLVEQGYKVIPEDKNMTHFFRSVASNHSFALIVSDEKKEQDLKFLREKLVSDLHRIAELENEELLDVNKAAKWAADTHTAQKTAFDAAVASLARNSASLKANEAREKALQKLVVTPNEPEVNKPPEQPPLVNKELDELLATGDTFSFDELAQVTTLSTAQLTQYLTEKGLNKKRVMVDGARVNRWVKATA